MTVLLVPLLLLLAPADSAVVREFGSGCTVSVAISADTVSASFDDCAPTNIDVRVCAITNGTSDCVRWEDAPVTADRTFTHHYGGADNVALRWYSNKYRSCWPTCDGFYYHHPVDVCADDLAAVPAALQPDALNVTLVCYDGPVPHPNNPDWLMAGYFNHQTREIHINGAASPDPMVSGFIYAHEAFHSMFPWGESTEADANCFAAQTVGLPTEGCTP